MKLRREFTGEVTPEEATERLAKIARHMKFREVRSEGHLIFTRGKPGSSLLALRPRSFETSLHVWIEGLGAIQSRITLELNVEPIFRPPHRLAGLLYQGELDDLEHGMLTNEPSRINRVKQNRMAGLAYLALLLVGLPITFGLARLTHLATVGIFAGFERIPSASLWLSGILCVIYYLAWLRFCGSAPGILIEYEVYHPKGAKIISESEEPIQAPTPGKSKAKPRA